jgi:3-phenylpropionate/trans-cinnamate dioxygenase ferredoxin component
MTAIAVCALEDIQPGSAKKVVVGNVEVALVRIDDDVYALNDKCSHANISLSEGIVWSETKELECPRHSSSFNLITGVPSTLPATQPVAVYTAFVQDGQVMVDVEAAK